MEYIRNATVAVNAGVSTEIAPAYYGQNSQRAVFMVTNLEAVGGQTVYLSFDEEAAANKGIPLAPGQSYLESLDAGYKPTNRICNAYSAGAMSVAIHERILSRG
jgi:hypothetical protein